MPKPVDRNTWHECRLLKDSLWSRVNELPLEAAAPFECIKGDEDNAYYLVQGPP